MGWTKAVPTGKNGKTESAVRTARQTGAAVQTTKRHDQSKSQWCQKLDDSDQAWKHATVGSEFKKALMQARMAKQMDQAKLAKAINEKASVINEYESGKAIPNNNIVNKLNKALGVRLPSAKM